MSEHISASQLNLWLRCPKAFEFRYMLGMKTPPSGALARGSACHKAWEADHRNKMITKQNLPMEEILDVYSLSFESSATGADFKGEDRGAMKDQGVAMTKIYHEEVSRNIQPVAVEEEFAIKIGDHKVIGFIDVETDAGEIRDAKTAARRKSNIPMDHQLQMAIYSRAKPTAKTFILDNAISANGKSAAVESLTLTRTDLPNRRLNSFLNAFGESLLKGLFPPTNPDNWCCSEKWCGFWHMCSCGGGSL